MHSLKRVLAQFQLEGRLENIQSVTTGHINQTFLSRFRVNGSSKHYIHQRINHYVFKEPEKVMLNIVRVTHHAQQKILAAGGDPARETLHIIPTQNGAAFCQDEAGNYWRTYDFIAGARTYDQIEDPRLAYNASKAFGKFQRMLSDLPGERLFETIPNFHHTRKRLADFSEAVHKDPCNRARLVQPEIDFVLQRAAQASVIVDGLANGLISERVTHNDTKLNNVLIDDETGEGICVIDLDTVMPGSTLYDFGDAVRVGASTAAEDETNLERVDIDLTMFDRLACGYLEAARDFLTPAELDFLSFSARLLTFECGMRFLTDYINGDVYFRIHREHHNLDRCRTQFKMILAMEEKADRMMSIIEKYRG